MIRVLYFASLREQLGTDAEELAPGKVIRWQSAVDGLTATVERWVYDAADDVLYHDTFVSEYAPRRAAYHYGPGYEPPVEEPQPSE